MGWTSGFPQIMETSRADAFEMACRKACTYSVYEVSTWLSVYCFSFQIRKTQVQALLKVRFFLNLNGVSLH